MKKFFKKSWLTIVIAVLTLLLGGVGGYALGNHTVSSQKPTASFGNGTRPSGAPSWRGQNGQDGPSAGATTGGSSSDSSNTTSSSSATNGSV